MDNPNKSAIFGVSYCIMLSACIPSIYTVILLKTVLYETLKYGENRY